MSYTKGPWFVEEYFDSSHGRFLFDVRSENSVVVGPEGIWDSEDLDRANARLIAAAPELLEALLSIFDINSPVEIGNEMGLKAIAKALGEPL